MFSKTIRLDADMAALFLEEADRHQTTPEALQELMQMSFEEDEKVHGVPTIEFLQGFFSGLMLAKGVLFQTEGGQQSADDVARLAVEAARRYIDRIEKEANK